MIITLRTPLLQKDTDLELPGDVEIQHLLPELVRALQLPTSGGADQYQLIRHKRRRALRKKETLLKAGVATGDILSLTSTSQMSGGSSGSQGRGYGTSALLRSQSGLVIALDNYGKTELSVGRYDARTGKSPDIDLSEEPDGNTVSRSHAKLRRQGQQWVLVPVSNKSPTYVGNILLRPQQPQPLKPGDVITLGNLQLTFETGRP